MQEPLSKILSSPSPGRRKRGRPRSATGNGSDPTPVQALERGIRLLQVLSKSGAMSLSDLSMQMGLPPSTTYRLLCTLQNMGFIEFDEASQEWAIGIEAFITGNAYFNRTNLLETARPIMRRLMEDTGETANLAVLTSGGHVTFLMQVESTHPIRAFHPPGTRSQAHASGIGKALLAERTVAEIERLLQQTGLQEFTRNTLTQPKLLFEDLQHSYQRGWAFDDEESYRGMRCIAAAIHNAAGEAIAGISISGPSARFGQDVVSAHGPRVRDAADEITHLIGGATPDYRSRQAS